MSFGEGVYEIDHAGHEYAVGVDYLDFSERIALYRDGVRVRISSAISGSTAANRQPEHMASNSVRTASGSANASCAVRRRAGIIA